MFPTEISNLPGQIEAALQFLRFTEEIAAPKNYGGPPEAGRDLTRTELEVKDSALTVLLEYFNQPLPDPDQGRATDAAVIRKSPPHESTP